MIRSQKRLGEILKELRLVSDEQLERALQEQSRTKEFLGKILLRQRAIREEDLLRTLSEQFGIPFVSLKNRYIDWEFVRRFSASLVFDRGCFPVEKDEWSVTMAITNPLDVFALNAAEKEAGLLKLKLVLVCEEDMQNLISRYRQYLRGTFPKMFE